MWCASSRLEIQMGLSFYTKVIYFELGVKVQLPLKGNTKVMASVVGPHPCRFKGDMKPEEALIVCKYSKPPFSSTSGERKKLSSRDRSSNDFASAIEVCLMFVVLP